jgi:hypothetical protein
MLKSSRTWPSILTMAVVQLKFDQKGKYSYSTIANINQSHKQQLIESHISITNNNGHSDFKNESQCQHNGGHKKDLITRKNVGKTRSLSCNGTTANGRQNGFQHHHNGNSLGCANSPGKNGKVCLCELEFRDNNRKRSESIKVDNWDYIFKEKAFKANLELPDEEKITIPK